MPDDTITTIFKGKPLEIKKSDINAFAAHLSEDPAYSSVNVDVHISFIYSGNYIAVKEFLDWKTWRDANQDASD